MVVIAVVVMVVMVVMAVFVFEGRLLFTEVLIYLFPPTRGWADLAICLGAFCLGAALVWGLLTFLTASFAFCFSL